ncbi:hypothetical protein B9H04_07365 [Halorubrum ezzemoulense DSM 17463]|uniref:Archaeal Type IV pilin N-terminal domain-containing protein n=2 Tax=Halorubrum ezzemoulense TaxID=337243 RepID=A0A1X4H8A4_HALEZ|nr:hypothetical protein B9H04_07365 [Halorubrum ezzemoulense DSM 17463]
MVTIVVILAAIVSVAAFGFVDNISEPAPNVADTTGEFEAGGDFDEQVVRITHIAGEDVALNDLEIVVRAGGESMSDTEVRLVNLPPSLSTFDTDSYEGNDGLASGQGVTDGVLFDGSSSWGAGQMIKFRIPVGAADFRDPPVGSNPDADELEVTIIHTPSGSIISRSTFTP